ncbi:MAG: TolC family protein [Alphaproteobacteria bacterium]|nr:TolC family protein [Alphaproteobacteria bacterium]
MKKYLSVFAFGVVFGAHGVDLEEAVISAYNNNAAWKAIRAEKNEADERYKQAEAVFLPTLDASLSASRVGNRSKTSQHTFIDGKEWESLYDHDHDENKQTNTQMSLRLRQNLFNSFQDVNTSKSKKNLAKAAFHKLKKAEQELIVKVVKTYTAVWAERQKLQAHIKKEENLKKLYESQEICLSAGMSTPAEVAEAEAKYQTAVYERVDAETRVVEAEALFKQITGLDADMKMFIPNLDIKLPKDLSQLERIALRSNQEILEEKFTDAAALNDLDFAKGSLGPKCELELEAGRRLNKRDTENKYFSRLTDSTHESQNTYKAELSVTVPVFNMPNYASIGAYSERAKSAKFKAMDKILEVKRDCQVYWRTYKSAEASIKANSTAVKSAEITSESNLDQANLGMKSNTEFLDVETSLLNARINLANSIKNKIDTMIQLFALTGNLDLRSMLVTLKKNKGVLDPVAAAKAREKARRARKSGKRLSKKEWLKQLAEKKSHAEKNQEKSAETADRQGVSFREKPREIGR